MAEVGLGWTSLPEIGTGGVFCKNLAYYLNFGSYPAAGEGNAFNFNFKLKFKFKLNFTGKLRLARLRLHRGGH